MILTRNTTTLTGRTSSPHRPQRAPRRAPQRSYAGRTAAERRADRRERLLTAGLELFGTDGYARTPIERICATAGVSTRNFYEEFTGREALLMALHDRVTHRALDAVATALRADAGASPGPGPGPGEGAGPGEGPGPEEGAGPAEGPGPEEGPGPGRAAATGATSLAIRADRVRRRIEVAADAYVTVLTSDPRWTRISSLELIGVSRAVEEHRLRWRALWAQLLESEAAKITGRPVEGRPEFHLAAVAIIGAVNELMLNWCTTGADSPPRRMTAIIVRFIIGMLTAP